MLVTTARCRAAAASVSMALALLVVIAVGGAEGDSESQSSTQVEPKSDHYYYRFHGYAEHVTIDGLPLQAGDTITPILNGEMLSTVKIPESGFFTMFMHDFTKPAIGDCIVVYVIRSQRHAEPVISDEIMYAKGCGDILVELEIVTTGQNQPSADSSAVDATTVAVQPQGGADGEAGDAEQAEQADMMEEIEDRDDERQRPVPPRTGTGGLKATEEQQTNWPVVAFIVIGLALLSSTAVVLVNRRTDQSRR